MKNTLKKLLIVAGICVASTSAFATNLFYVQVDNVSNHPIKINWSHGGDYMWDNSHYNQSSAIQMEGVTTLNPNTRVGVQTADSYTWGNPDRKYFSIIVQDPNNPNRGKEFLFSLSNEPYPRLDYGTGLLKIHDGGGRGQHKIVIKFDGTHFDMDSINYPGKGVNETCDWDSIGCWEDFKEHDNRSLDQLIAYDYSVPTAASQLDPGTSVIGAGNCVGMEQWDKDAFYKSGHFVTYKGSRYKSKWEMDQKGIEPGTPDRRNGYPWDFLGYCKITGGPARNSSASMLSADAAKAAVAVKIPAPKGSYDFGQWKAGEYPVIYSPKEIHPFVTYNGKGYVACNGDTTAKDVPGKSEAWKEVNGSLGNTCGYTVHSYKKQSPTPSVAKSGVAFW